MEPVQPLTGKAEFLKGVLLKAKVLLARKKKLLFAYQERLREEQVRELREKLSMPNNHHENTRS